MSVQINESTKTVPEEAAAGAAVYSNLLLSIYDLEVLMRRVSETMSQLKD